MKKLLITCLLLIPFYINAKNNLSKGDVQLKNSLLWEVTGKEITEPSYLYGTMHLICDLSTTNKAKVQKAVDASQQLYLEVDMFDPNQAASIMTALSEGTKIKDIEDQEKKQKLLELSEKHLGMSGSIVENTNLFTIFSMVAFKAMDACAFPTSVEESIESKFDNDRSKIAGLETIAEQMEFIKASEVANLDNTIIGLQEFDNMKIMMKELDALYMSENINGLYTLMTEPSEVYTQEYIDKMMAVLLDKRNKNWVKQIPEIAESQPTFFAVGAGHLPGKNGVINLLREAGYTVKAVME
ncbi:MAG: TraB/GumN family protein [Marinicellaceae bacterium]